MKAIVIGQEKIKRELWILLICFVVAILFNVYAIATKGTEWTELWSQLHVAVLLSVVLYVLLGIIRLILYGIVRPFSRKR